MNHIQQINKKYISHNQSASFLKRNNSVYHTHSIHGPSVKSGNYGVLKPIVVHYDDEV